MTPKQLILHMVEAWRNPVTKRDTLDFGSFDKQGVCWGCVATNFIVKTDPDLFEKWQSEYSDDNLADIPIYGDFIHHLESAIDSLRVGELNYANYHFKNLKLPQIINPNWIALPRLLNAAGEKEFAAYEQLAHDQES